MSAVLELWDDVEAAGGSPERGMYGFVEASMARELDQTHQLTIEAPRTLEWMDILDVRKVIRVTTDHDEVSEWRVATVTDSRGEDGTTTILADPIHVDLRDVGFIRDVTSGGISNFNLGLQNATLKNYVDTFILPFLSDEGMGWINRGTVENNPRLDISFERWTPRELIQRLADDTAQEWRLRRNGASEWLIDFVDEINSSASQVLISDQRNLLKLKRERVREGMYTVIQPMGDKPAGSEERATIGFAAWEVDSITVDSPTSGQDTVVLKDRNGGAGPIIEDDQLNGMYLLLPDATLEEILDSTASDDSVVIGDSTGLSVGDDVEVRADSSGTLLYELDSPSAVANQGRIVGTYERRVRGERNYTPNPFATDWASKPEPISCRVDGAVSSGGTSIPIKGAPANHQFKTGDAVHFIVDEASHHLASDTAADGSGNATLTVANNTVALDDNDPVHVHSSTGKEPDDWAYQPTNGQARGFFSYRDPSDVTNLSGAINGAVSNGSVIDLDGLTAGETIYPGDYLDFGTGTSYILNQTTVSSGGNATVVVSGLIGTLSDNTSVTIKRPGAFDVQWFTNLVHLPITEVTPAMHTPSYKVKRVQGLDTMWVSAGLTVTAMDSATVGTGEDYTGPSLDLWDANAGSSLASVSWAGGSLAAESETHITLRASHTMTGDADVLARVGPINSTATSPTYPEVDPTVYVRWVMIHLGVEGEVGPVWGSRATKLWQDGNAELQDRAGWPTTYTPTIRELRELWDADPAEPEVVIGGTIRLKSPSMGIDVTTRVVSALIDLVNPENTRLQLDTRRTRLTKSVARAKPRPLFAEVNVSVEDGEVNQSLVTSEDPPDKEGSVRGIGDETSEDGVIEVEPLL